MSSFRSKVAKFFIKSLRSYSIPLLKDLKKLRVHKEKWFGRLTPPSKVRFENINMGGLSAVLCQPPLVKNAENVVLYIHGGGYASCSTNSHKGIVGKFTLELGMPVYCFNYRLAPENPFPAAQEDALIAYNYLREYKQIAAKNIIVIGDSAGGGLALSMLLKLRDTGLEQPLTAVLLSPWGDLTMSSYSALHADDPLLPLEACKEWASWYAGSYELTNPYISPVYADMGNLCPLLVHVGTAELLHDDSITLKANADKTETTALTLEVWDDMFHVWHMSWRMIPESWQAMEKVYTYINDKIAANLLVTKG
jgi:epsilon-lactone hydrolase